MSALFGSAESHEWLNDAACQNLDIKDFFVEAGHVIDDKVLSTCRGCPVRRECVKHAYSQDVTGGYFGGLSPGQRREMTLAQALEYIKTDVNAEVVDEEVDDDDVEDFDYR